MKRLVKGGGWGLSQGKQGIDESDGSTFFLVGIDIFLTTYLMHGPFAYKFSLFSFLKYVRVLFIRISPVIRNTLWISFDTLWEFWELFNILLVIFRWGQLNSQIEPGVVCLGGFNKF